jgi:phage terminase large subunit-like protein
MPARQAAFRDLILNQRVEASSPFIAAAQWQACAGAPLDLTGRDVFAGLDLSETQDLTALVLVGADITDGTWHCEPTFWLPGQGLHDKARAVKLLTICGPRKAFCKQRRGARSLMNLSLII